MIKYKTEALTKSSIYESVEFGYETSKIYVIKKVNDGLNGILIEEKNQYYKKAFNKHNNIFEKNFDFSNWKIICAYDDKKLVGGAIVCGRTPKLNMLDSRKDLLVIWDLRVSPKYQKKGVGKGIIRQVKKYAKKNNYIELKLESQNTNYNANKFYHHVGFSLSGICEHKYIDYPNEVAFYWFMKI